VLVFYERHKPLVFIVSWGSHAPEDFDAYHAHFAKWHAARERVLVLSDPRAQEMPNAHYRKRYAEMADEITSTFPKVAHASAAVLGSALLVGAARAVAWLRKRNTNDNAFYCQTAVDGVAWLTEQGAAAKLVVPAPALELAKELDACARRGGNPRTLVS
jgi:hypothetical protein